MKRVVFAVTMCVLLLAVPLIGRAAPVASCTVRNPATYFCKTQQTSHDKWTYAIAGTGAVWLVGICGVQECVIRSNSQGDLPAGIVRFPSSCPCTGVLAINSASAGPIPIGIVASLPG